MMTIRDIGEMLDMLESNYGQKFYDGVNRDNVVKTWSVMFKNDNPSLVMYGVQSCINTMGYKPTISDIRKWMAKAKMGGQMTEIEAFQAVKTAVDKATDRAKATEAFNALPPILRKLVGNASQLRDWREISVETFETVTASLIARSYRELAEQELNYNTLPEQLQKISSYMIDAPDYEALPEQKKEDKESELRNMQMTPELQAKTAAKVADFLAPMSEKEIKKIEEQETERLMRRLSA